MYGKTEPCPKCRALGNDRAGDNLVVFPNGHKHCFSCKHHVFPSHFIPKVEKPNGPKNLLPLDFTREVPTTAFKWLLQYGLPWSYWKDQVGYSPSEERLVFLVGKPHQFSIGRYVGARVGKEAPRKGSTEGSFHPKWKCWGDSHKHCETIEPTSLAVATAEGQQVVLVEDLISAHKVATSVPSVAAIPLFGTQVHKPHLYFLMNCPEGTIIHMWLDKDQQGLVMKKAANLSALTGLEVRCISTNDDPKSLTKEQICSVLTN